ncbi:MAG: alpha/beta hydrolase [Alphaproteobacteria bacterium]|nr:alpha/beta hydrolase [Alphaproteobacteria bacterium]
MTFSRRDTLFAGAATALVQPAHRARAADAPIRRHYVSAWTGQVHLRLAGEPGAGKRPVLCLHPSLASSLNFVPLMTKLGSDRFVFAPDTPGYGMSDAPPAQPSIADYARAMADVVDALKLPEYDLLGAHTGSKTCVELARLQPRQVKHLALVAAPVYTPADVQHLRERNPVDPPDESGEFLARAWKRRAAGRDPRSSLDEVMAKFPDYLMGGDKRVWGQVAAFGYHFEDTIGKVAVPVMVLNPKGDLFEMTLRIAPHIKNGKLINLPQSAPSFLETDVDASLAMLRDFYDEDRYPT